MHFKRYLKLMLKINGCKIGNLKTGTVIIIFHTVILSLQTTSLKFISKLRVFKLNLIFEFSDFSVHFHFQCSLTALKVEM